MGYVTNPFVSALLARAYGQGGAVSVPQPTEPDFPRGRFPAGVKEVLERLGEQYATWDSRPTGDVEWCFLVGGPGNGKSEALGMLAGALKVELPNRSAGDPAPRTVPSDWPSGTCEVTDGLDIVFINDASIPRQVAAGARQPGSLFLDMRDATQRLVGQRTPTIVFGNVNRGILVEEQAALQYASGTSLADDVARAVINWLADPPEIEDTGPSGAPASTLVQTVVAPVSTRPYFGQIKIPLADNDGATHNILIHVVFLDVLSLLEPTPGAPGQGVGYSGTRPVVEDYRPIGGFSRDGASRNDVVAGELLATITEAANWDAHGCVDAADGTICAAFDMCPLAQNAKWLRTSRLRERFLDTLRAAEIAASRRLTYRDLLGHFSLAILGEPEQDWLAQMHPCQWVGARVQTLIMGQANKSRAAFDLVNHRVYANLFPTFGLRDLARAAHRQGDTVYGAARDRLSLASEPRGRAFVWAFAAIDPARDLDPWNGLRTRVLDVIESLEVVLPAQQLAGWRDLPAEAQSTIERKFDIALRDEVMDELHRSGSGSRDAAVRLRFLRKWRGVLLLRQVGLVLGQIAFRPAIAAWLAEQRHALDDGALSDLGKGVQALILPLSTNEFLLAPLRPRTIDLVAAPPPNSLLVEVPADNLRVTVVPKGDILVAEVQWLPRRGRGEAEVVASLVIDLAIAREALLHTQGRTASFTEIGDSAFARIERVLASLVGRERLKKLAVEFTDENGRRFRVLPGLGAAPSLRVQPI